MELRPEVRLEARPELRLEVRPELVRNWSGTASGSASGTGANPDE
ncbi:MAG: hypothetical protein SGJ27_09810 [Candidatus Melainabacteria bacterium]|nr:hypothetical protein [Candidatus Melainabacteria bacterium]